MLTRLAGLPFLDGRVTQHAGPTFLHIKSFFALPARIQLGQGEMDERARLLAFGSGKGVKTFFSCKRLLKICREGDPPSLDSFSPY